MIRLEMEGKAVTVSFKHHRTEQEKKLGKGGITECEIRVYPGLSTKQDDYEVYASGASCCLATDPFCFEKGRRLAMTRTMLSSEYYREHRRGVDKRDRVSLPTLLRKERTAIWKAYWAQKTGTRTLENQLQTVGA